jgi:acyl-CoA dehydrogenase
VATVEQAVHGGVSFALTEEQKALRALAREFAEKEIRPRAAEYDDQSIHPADVIEKAHEVGLMNLHLPEPMGGPGLSAFDGMLVGEELSWGCSGIGTSLAANGLGAAPVLLAGTEQQKADWLPPLLERPILCSFGLSEPGAGSDVARMKTTAVRKGGEYVLNGSKTFITNAGHAAWTVVFGKTDPEKGHRGISAFVVPMDTPGVTVEKHLDKMGQRATDTAAFALQEVVVPAANRLGDEGDGFKIAMRTLDFTRPGTAAGAVGVAQAAYELAVEYAKERVTFDVPIAMHQGVNFMIADMATEIEAARLLTWQAAWLHDQGVPGDAAVVVREAIRGRHGDEGHDRRRAGLRRLWLHQGVPGREADAGREAFPDLRRHVPDPATGDRQGDLPAPRPVGSAGWRWRSTSPAGWLSSPAAPGVWAASTL